MTETIYKSYKEYCLTIGDATFTFFTDKGAIADHTEDNSIFHSHDFCELFYVSKGKIEIESENKTLCLNENDVALIPQGISHKINASDNTQRIVISFVCSKSKYKSKETYYAKFIPVTKNGIIIISNFAGVDSFHRFARYYYGNYSEKHQLILSCLHEIIALTKEFATENKFSKDSFLTDSILYRNYIISDYLETNFAQANLSGLADVLNLSCQQTHRIIKNRYKKSFNKCIMDIKMKHALHLIKDTALPFSEISSRVGYKCTHSFFAAFKNYYGVTPGSVRNNHLR